MTGEFQPSRLTVARERRGFTKADLAEQCDVSRRTVSDWEAGRIQSPPIERIAAVLGFPAAFFEQESTTEITPDRTSFRALTAMSARQVKMVLANAVIVESLTEWIDLNFTTPPVELPSLEELAPTVALADGLRSQSGSRVGAADSLRAIWSMNGGPIPDLMALLESKGVRIFALAVDVREVDAFSLWLGERPTIFLNTEKSAERLRFDLAHELAHLVMHRGFVTVGNRASELEANAFASELLMPATGLMSQVRAQISFQDVFALKKYWMVSATAMVVRLQQLHLINDWQYRNWMVELSKRGFRRREPDGGHPERSALLGQVMRFAREDGWSTSRLAARLAIPVEDLLGAVRGLTLSVAG